MRIRLFQELLPWVGSDAFSWFLPSIGFLFLILVLSMLSFLDSCHKYTHENQIFKVLLSQWVSAVFSWFLSSTWSNVPSTPSLRSFRFISLIPVLNMQPFSYSYLIKIKYVPSLPSSKRFRSIFPILVLNITRVNPISQATPSSKNFRFISLITSLNMQSFPVSFLQYPLWESDFPSLPSSSGFSCIILILVLK